MIMHGHHAALLKSPQGVVDLRSVIRTVGCRAYWRADDVKIIGAGGVTSRMTRFAGGDFFGGGDIVPSGSLTRFLPMRLVISTGGGYGVGKFNLSFDGGVTFAMTNVTIAASVALTGVGTGTTLSFSNVSYVLNNIFETGHELWDDRSVNNYDVTRSILTYYLACRLRYGDWSSVSGTTLPNTIPIVITEPSGGGPSDNGHTLPQAAVVMPSPGTTPTYISAMIRQLTITGSSVERSICIGTTASKFRIWIRGDGQVTIDNGTTRVWPSYTFTKWGNWFRLRAYFSNSSSDMLQLGADSTTFASAGNNSDTAFQMLMRTSATEAATGTLGQQGVAEFSVWNGMPTANELLREDAYYTARYGAGPTTA